MPAEFTLDLDSVLNRKFPIIDRIDPTRTAIIGVDMQRFFLEPGQPAYLPGGDGAPSAEVVVENVVHAVDLCRRHGIQVIWSRWGLAGRRLGCRALGAKVADMARRDAEGPSLGKPRNRDR